MWARIDGEWVQGVLDRWHRDGLVRGEFRWRGLVWLLVANRWVWVEAVDLRPREPDKIV